MGAAWGEGGAPSTETVVFRKLWAGKNCYTAVETAWHDRTMALVLNWKAKRMGPDSQIAYPMTDQAGASQDPSGMPVSRIGPSCMQGREGELQTCV